MTTTVNTDITARMHVVNPSVPARPFRILKVGWYCASVPAGTSVADAVARGPDASLSWAEVSNVAIPPEGYDYQQTRQFAVTGDYVAWPAVLDAVGWITGDVVTFTVSPAPVAAAPVAAAPSLTLAHSVLIRNVDGRQDQEYLYYRWVDTWSDGSTSSTAPWMEGHAIQANGLMDSPPGTTHLTDGLPAGIQRTAIRFTGRVHAGDSDYYDNGYPRYSSYDTRYQYGD